MRDLNGEKFFIKTFGCQMNDYDSHRMGDLLIAEGYAQAACPEEADVVILNTCHIREKASEKVFSDLGRLKEIKRDRFHQRKSFLIGVAGCVAQAEGDLMRQRAPFVDMIFGPAVYHRLGSYIRRARAYWAQRFDVIRNDLKMPESNPSLRGAGLLDIDFPAEDKFDFLLPPQGKYTAFVPIQEGCDKFCTYCVVPYTRGNEYSRSVGSVLSEIHGLVAQGVQEITLIGQNVNNYHGLGPEGTPYSLGRLMRVLGDHVPSLRRLRYVTSYPADTDEDLIAAHRDLPYLVPFLHLPVQSGSDRILREMNRRHGRAFYLDLAERLRIARADLMLSSDFIVGFPSETDADFQETLDLVREVGFIQSYSFAYSPRPGTPAATRGDQIPEDVKKERLLALQNALEAIQVRFNQDLVGKSLDVFFDQRGKAESQVLGRSPYMQPVHVDNGLDLLGKMARIEITKATNLSLHGKCPKDTPAFRAKKSL